MNDKMSTGTRRSDQPADPAVMANSQSKKPQIGDKSSASGSDLLLW